MGSGWAGRRMAMAGPSSNLVPKQPISRIICRSLVTGARPSRNYKPLKGEGYIKKSSYKIPWKVLKYGSKKKKKRPNPFFLEST